MAADATPFDMRGVVLGHQGPDRTFETILRRRNLTDLEDDRFDAPDAPGLDSALRGLSMTLDDPAVLAISGPIFDGLYEYYRRATLLGRTPA